MLPLPQLTIGWPPMLMLLLVMLIPPPEPPPPMLMPLPPPMEIPPPLPPPMEIPGVLDELLPMEIPPLSELLVLLGTLMLMPGRFTETCSSRATPRSAASAEKLLRSTAPRTARIMMLPRSLCDNHASSTSEHITI